ncbi:MAG TPA: hypothetical protein VFF68_11630, partial [Anaerolineaceae bacterium]|nr:hypothetical protein [Anaerolineaceae bacterium]
LRAGLLDNEVFSAVIGTVLITTLVTPPLLRASFTAERPLPARPVQTTDAEKTGKIDEEEAA